MEDPRLHEDSPGWIFYVHASFAISVTLMCIGIYVLPVGLWIKGYLAMGLFFTIGSTVSLAKTMRDQHEARKLVNRINEVKTEKILNDYSLTRP